MREIRPKVFGTSPCLLAIAPREKTAATLGVPFLWLSTATAAAIKIKIRIKELGAGNDASVQIPPHLFFLQASLKNSV